MLNLLLREALESSCTHTQTQYEFGFQISCIHCGFRCHFRAELFPALRVKCWRGAGSRNDCRHAPECWSQTWSAVQKVTRPHSVMESRKQKKTPPAKALARKSLLKSKTCKRRYVCDTNECFCQKLLAINHWHALSTSLHSVKKKSSLIAKFYN